MTSLRLGAHVTSDDPVADALGRGADLIQLFLGDPQGWKGPVHTYPGGPQALRDAFVKVRGSARVTSADPEASYQALEKYSTDLTARAREGELDPVIGRDNEIRRVIQVLSRRTKNNPVLIGEPGVGKTAIVEGLAQRIVAGSTPTASSNGAAMPSACVSSANSR